jgi:hypothetical protein
MEDGLAVKAEETKFMLLSRNQNARKNHDIKIANTCFEDAVQFRYLETKVTNWHLIQEDTKKRLNYDNPCYHSLQNLLCSCLITRIYKTACGSI